MLALAHPAEGKVIYTPSHVRIAVGNDGNREYHYPLDLNHDGVVDFSLRMSRTTATEFFQVATGVGILGVSGNQAAGVQQRKGYDGLAYALRAGRRIGPDRRFGPYNNEVMAVRATSGEGVTCLGPWDNATKRYLGLRFTINGELHYGWARLDVSCPPKVSTGGLSGILTGYAYETIPNKPIIAGKTKGPDVITVQPGSLGRLALGRK